MVGPTGEARFLNLAFYNPKRDNRVGGGRRDRKRKNKFHCGKKKKKKTFIAVIFITEKNCKLLRCPIGECPARILTQ